MLALDFVGVAYVLVLGLVPVGVLRRDSGLGPGADLGAETDICILGVLRGVLRRCVDGEVGVLGVNDFVMDAAVAGLLLFFGVDAVLVSAAFALVATFTTVILGDAAVDRPRFAFEGELARVEDFFAFKGSVFRGETTADPLGLFVLATESPALEVCVGSSELTVESGTTAVFFDRV